MMTNTLSAKIGTGLLALIIALSALTAFSTPAFAASNSKAKAEVSQSNNRSFMEYWNSWRYWYASQPTIRDIDPEEGPIGTTITLTGRKFTDNSIVRFGKGAIHDVEVSKNGKSLTFVVPADVGRYCPPNRVCTAIAYGVEAGDYKIRVQNGNKTSNAVHFEVTGTTTGTTTPPATTTPLAIKTIEGPTALLLGAEGTWNLDVDSEGTTSLQYSVKWGDEGTMMKLLALDNTTQSSATFTHTYTDEGTFEPEFTVTDGNGHTVTKVAAKVVVGAGDTSAVPHINTIAPNSGAVGLKVTLMGSGFDSTSTVAIGSSTASDITVVDDTKITFVVPTLATGTYAVAVTDDDGTSNSVDFTVTVKKGQVSINGVNAPTRLQVGEVGTWVVKAASNLSGNLEYTADWGASTFARKSAAANLTTQSSAEFTHAYDSAGSYKPKFTVTDEQGNSANVSASVIVSGTTTATTTAE